jgi:hypothetical protein
VASTLTTHFVDGSDVDVTFVFDERRIEMSAFDEKTRKRYHLTFADCTFIKVAYSDEDKEWADLNNLTEGVQELETLVQGVRRFQIGFADESLVEIHCRNFSMEPLS